MKNSKIPDNNKSFLTVFLKSPNYLNIREKSDFFILVMKIETIFSE